ncbi:hypothetical protein Pcinc_027107 [Petrolisthes cinctipes]|uniref:Uncharacterized protein n=1 Tax=Petrolisthes cinctipes TaxID=88211 RepID=A0AAE1K932_PETCI|nr:hypothetical protein Pcinc_027107 [Petrolisthes cinctipes]
MGVFRESRGLDGSGRGQVGLSLVSVLGLLMATAADSVWDLVISVCLVMKMLLSELCGSWKNGIHGYFVFLSGARNYYFLMEYVCCSRVCESLTCIGNWTLLARGLV